MTRPMWDTGAFQYIHYIDRVDGSNDALFKELMLQGSSLFVIDNKIDWKVSIVVYL